MAKKSILTFLISGLFLTACGAAMSSEPEVIVMEAPAMEMADDFGGGFEEEAAFDESTWAKAQNTGTAASGEAIQRMVIKNADLSIVVDDPLQKMDSIVALAAEMGGFVVDSNVWQTTLSSGAKVPHASITIRVLAENLEVSLERIKEGVSEISSESVSGQDVTSEYTDLKSRLKNLEAAEAQLQEIMDEATDTEDVLQVYNNLVDVRGQIEVIKGQMEYYEDSARLSRISVDITGDEEAQPLQIGGWKPAGVAKEAIETMINTLQWLGDAAIWVVLCVVPIGVVVGIPGYFIVRYLRGLRKRYKETKAAEKEVSANDVEEVPESE
jgi:hypothetical protein